MQQRRGDCAVQPNDAAVLQLLLPGAGKQRPIDRLPGLRPDRTDGLLQYRLFGSPRYRKPGKGPERRRVLKMERQLFVTQLTMLLEKGASQHRLRRQALPSRLLDLIAAKIACHQTEHRAMLIQPVRHRLQLAADLVPGEKIEYAGLGDAFLTHCRLRLRRLFFGISDLTPKFTQDR